MMEKLKTFSEDLFLAFLEELLNKKLNYCSKYDSNFVLIGKTLRSISIFVLKKIKLLHYQPTLYYYFQSYIKVMLILKEYKYSSSTCKKSKLCRIK